MKHRHVAGRGSATAGPSVAGGVSKPKQQKKRPALPQPVATSKHPKHTVGSADAAASHIPYSTEDHILLVGEGNYSFAAALANMLGCAEQLVATSYDSEEEVQCKYPDASQHTSLVADLGGTVLHGVDARNLAATKALKGRRFTKVVFNFPHVGAGIKDQDRNIASNQAMLTAFFSSAKQLLSSPTAGVVYTSQGPVNLPHGEVHVTLKKGLPYDEWGVTALAAAMGYATKACAEFRPEWYEGYEHRRTIGYDATKAGNVELADKACRTWVFVLKTAMAPSRAGKAKGSKGRGGKHRGAARQQPKGKSKRLHSDSDSD